MLHEFLIENREELIERCRHRAQLRNQDPSRASSGIGLFVDQLIMTLEAMLAADPQEAVQTVGQASGREIHSDIGASAAVIGKDLLALGLTIDEVVHNYGDVCQTITEVAVEDQRAFSVEEYRTLNRCIDIAVAHAVAEFSYQRDFAKAEQIAQQANQRFLLFSTDLRQLLGTATLAFSAARTGGLTLSGATGTILERSLNNIGKLIDNFTEDVQQGPSADILRVYSLADLINEIQATAALAAEAHHCQLRVTPVERELGLEGNRDLLFAALINLLQNAFDYAGPQSTVTLSAYATGDRIRIEIMDQCAPAEGAPAGHGHRKLRPPGDEGAELSLSLARRFVAANDGVLTRQKVAGVGSVFTINLPRHTMPA